MCPNSTLRQMQWVLPSVDVTYEKFIKRHKEKLEIIHEDVGEGASIHWIGPKSSNLVMLFFHGGGYVMPAVDAHFDMVDYWRTKMRKSYDIDFSIAFVQYSLVNFAPWPQQLRQVVAAFTHLINQGVHPSNIILAGDSVGGHQVAFLLGHILHPHPGANPVPKLSSPLAGAAMLSPWLTFSDAAPSFSANAETDLMPTPALLAWGDLLKESRGESNDGNWFEPAEAPAEWWIGLDKVVSNILITTATGECMLDDILSAGEKMRKGMGSEDKVEIFVQDEACHNEILAEFATYDPTGPSTDTVTKWIADVFS
ncbi:hypothetical protein GALMADRAFT_77381 [Galerina marginata CBS 339.88]|uniref:Alpha/beta hydrolase fold-3 domain-containing protein n=1 Tax=Galerina marginata (strain CBS 339.88) TaxID=685588 RepID=A0A067SHU2_GALM3|nr:hypothetical protein GALMADRAFT_77381 [Galerina marginata CBS 339.88]